MQCPYCNNFIDDDSRFCRVCGKTIVNDTYQSSPFSTNQFIDNSLAMNSPLHPDGTPFSKEDYLSLSKEYQEAEKKIARKYNTSGCFTVVLGVICAGLCPILWLVTFNSAVGISLLIAAIVILSVAAMMKPIGDRKVKELQDQYYRDYINHIQR